MKRRILLALYIVLILTYLGFLLYFLTIRPGGPSGNQNIIWAITGFASGGMMMMAIYAATLYLFQRGERAALYFALFCIGAGIRFFVMEGSLTLIGLVPGVTYGMALAIRYPAIGLIVIGVTSFIFEIFAAPEHKKRLPMLNVAAAVSSVAVVPAAMNGGGALPVNLAYYLLIFIIMAYAIFVVVTSAGLRGNRLNMLYLFVLLFYEINSVPVAFLYGRFPHMAVLSNTVFVIAHVVLLSDRYARAIRAVEEANILLEQKVAERTAELRKVNINLAASENSVREVMRNISHDLKTPMTVMSANLELMHEDKPASEAFRRHLSIATSHGKELARLAGRLLEASRAQTPETESVMELVHISALLEEAYQKYAFTVEEAGLDFLIGYGTDCEVWIDKKKILSVFGNIVGNALRFTKSGSIRVAAEEPENGTVSVNFTDTGCGIAPEHLPRIFDINYMADPSRAGIGSGLGLYIVKTGVERMGGSVSAKSDVGVGTEIIVRLKARVSP